MEKAAEEIAACSRYDYLIVNERLEQAVEEMTAVILAERCRSARRLSEVASRFPSVGIPEPSPQE
jgi:guanylate kinase